MVDYQNLIFRWAEMQTTLTGAVVFALGLLCGLQGFRFVRMLLPIWCMLVAFHFGLLLADWYLLPRAMTPALLAATVGFITLMRYEAARVLAAGSTYGLIAYYLAFQLGLPSFAMSTFGALAASAGVTHAWVRGRSLPLLLTTTYGAGLILTAYVITTNSLIPTLGVTFVQWADRVALMVPALLVMLGVMNYSCQCNLQQGDIRTGASRMLGAY